MSRDLSDQRGGGRSRGLVISTVAPPLPCSAAISVPPLNSFPEMIRLVVMMYVRFPLSLRNVVGLLFERGIGICHEPVWSWWNRFGPLSYHLPDPVTDRRDRADDHEGGQHDRFDRREAAPHDQGASDVTSGRRR